MKNDVDQNDYKTKCENQKQRMLEMLDSFKEDQNTLLEAAKFDQDQEKKVWELERQQLDLQIKALKVQVQSLEMKNKFNL